jgi:hypothetical protein
MVNYGEIGNVIQKTIDCDVAAKGILLRSSKTIGSENLSILGQSLLIFGMTPERGYLHHLSTFKKDMNQPETASDDPAVFKEIMDLMGMGIGGDIEIFGDFSKEKIANASPDETGLKSMPVKTVEYFQGLFIDHGP